MSFKGTFLGRKNPNVKYQTLDDNFFDSVETKEKAYLLGWIASDGYINESGFRIQIHEKDICCLNNLRDIICKEIPIKNHGFKKQISITVNSKIISKSLCNLLKINPGKKCDSVCFPELKTDELKWSFIRGYFDGDGSINKPNDKNRYPKCDITSKSKSIRDSIEKFCGIPCSNSNKTNRIYWSHNNALDFLGKLYENTNLHLSRKRDLYLDWCAWQPSLSGGNNHGYDEFIKWNKTRKDAVPPSKSKVTDSGYDLVLLEKVKQIGEVELYDTGIKIQPPFGWYFDLVPRSSIIKTGYMLANSIGIIDRTYTGNILVPLIKIDKNVAELQLPQRLVQLIPRQIIHAQVVEVESLDETERGSGGFGSTGTK